MKNNTLRKLGLCAATLSMTAALSFGAFAPALVFAEETDAPVVYSAGNQDNSVTVTSAPVGQTFNLYQLFTGNFAESTVIPPELVNGTASAGKTADKNKMGLAEFGSSVNDEGKAIVDSINEFMKTQDANWTDFAINETSHVGEAEQVVDELGSVPALSSTGFSNILMKNITKAGYKVASTEVSTAAADGDKTADVTFKDLASGYYLIANAAPSSDQPAESKVDTSAILVPVQGDVSIYSKSSMPTLDKEVSDTADENGWGSAADVGLIKPDENGDLQINDLKYRLTGTVAKNISDYETYEYTFADTLPNGIVFDGATTADQLVTSWNMKYYVQVGDNAKQEMTTAPTLTIHNPAQGSATTASSLVWTWTDLKTALKDMNIDISYANAENIKIIIEYAPQYTKEQIATIYKNYSSADKPQTNSAFVVFPNNPTTEDKGKTPTDETNVYSFNLMIQKTDEDGNLLDGAEFTLTGPDEKPAGNFIGKDPNGNSQFTWTGLDGETEYTLTETKVPDGYKSIGAISFIIHPLFEDTNGDGNDELKTVTVEITNNPGGALTQVTEAGGTWMLNLTTVAGSIVNVSGPSLPVTGQAGIWTGVAAGGAVIAISAYAILKKKKTAE